MITAYARMIVTQASVYQESNQQDLHHQFPSPETVMKKKLMTKMSSWWERVCFVFQDRASVGGEFGFTGLQEGMFCLRMEQNMGQKQLRRYHHKACRFRDNYFLNLKGFFELASYHKLE